MSRSKVVLLSKYQKAGGGVGIKTKLSPNKLTSPNKKAQHMTHSSHRVNQVETCEADEEIMNI